MRTAFMSIVAIIVLWEICEAAPKESEHTLVLTHVLFRHGDRNPDESSLYKRNPYYDEKFYPNGYGHLTERGKKREYDIGAALRARYNDFLGDVWSSNIYEVRSTDYNRTKMSAQLVVAGLWPNIFTPEFPWDSIPIKYENQKDDKELLPLIACQRKLITAFLKDRGIEPIPYLIKQFGKTLTKLIIGTKSLVSPTEALDMYFGFAIQEELNFPLEEWTKSVYPEPLRSLVVEAYHLVTSSTHLRRIASGFLLKKIITDTQNKIDNTLTPADRKMFLYGAHETTVSYLLLSLGVYDLKEIPPYGAYVLIEIHKINGVHGVKIFYQDYSNVDPKPLQVPGCGEFCPFSEFINHVKGILPESDHVCK